MSTSDPQQLRHAMTDDLVKRGLLPDKRWQGAIATVARHWFLTRFFQPINGGEWELVEPAHPNWLPLAHMDTAWALQLDHDERAVRHAQIHGQVAGTPTRWAPAPSTTAAMLTALDVHDGQRVLCLGDATGYHAALLAHRLGAASVTTVEADGHRAGQMLFQAGYPTPVFVGDPAAGYSPAGPYQRILAITPMERIPAAWVTQALPGAIIVAALRTTLTDDLLVRLNVQPGGTTRGRFLPTLAIRPPATGLLAETAGRLAETPQAPECVTRPTRLHPDVLHGDFGVIAALHNPRTHFLGPLTPNDPRYWLLSHDAATWAAVDPANGEVTFAGPRDLWSEVELAHHRWLWWGSPPLHRLGLTVTATGTNFLWLDCAARRSVVSPAQRAEMRGDISGPDG